MIKDLINRVKYVSPKNKRLLFNTAFSVLIKGGALLIALLTLPAYMRFFSKQEVLGLWFTVLSVLSWILTFDLGIGNGLKNHLIEAFTKNDIDEAKAYISSGYVITGIIVLISSVLGYFGSRFINWNSIFNIPESIVPQFALLKMVQLTFIGIMLQFFFRLIYSVLFALQKSAVPNFLALLSNVLILGFVLVVKSGSVIHNLEMLSYFNIIAANLPLLVVTIVLFSTTLRKCIPNFKNYNKKFAVDIMKLGGTFFWIQIMFMLITSTNEFLITWFAGAHNVVDYKIYNSLFNVISGVFLIALTPVWSEVTEAITLNEYSWIQKLYKKLKQLMLVAIFCEIVMVFLLQVLVNIWLKDKAIRVSWGYATTFAFSGILFIWVAMLTSITNGIKKLQITVVFLTLGAVINVPLAYLFCYFTNSWISIMFANIISILPFCIVQSVWLNKYLKKNTNPAHQLA